MNILIADDSLQKQELLKELIIDEYPNGVIFQTDSFNSTFKEIKSRLFDLILLDMTMPTFEQNKRGSSEGKVRTLAGKDIISKMVYRNIITPTILVTQFEVFGRHNHLISIKEMADELMINYPEIVRGCILFDFQSDIWKKEIK
ncbi:response regulator, partial [Yersinia enterocolitica]|nr:response regulator [Yersinia enterocolitica]